MNIKQGVKQRTKNKCSKHCSKTIKIYKVNPEKRSTYVEHANTTFTFMHAPGKRSDIGNYYLVAGKIL